jgi:hypothetical protein
MNYPNQWVAGQEYDFGNGLYGKRITGTITIAANTQSIVNVVASGATGIVDNGGYLTEGETGVPATVGVGQSLLNSSGTTNMSSDVRLVNTTGAINIASRSVNARNGNTNSRYDVWVKYTK